MLETSEHPGSNDRQKIRREILAQYMLLAANFAFPAAFAIIVSIYFGSAIYGQIAPLLALLTITSILSDFGAQISAPLILGHLKSADKAIQRAQVLIKLRIKLALFLFLPAGLIGIALFLPSDLFIKGATLVLVAGISAAISPAFYFFSRGEMHRYVPIVLLVRGPVLFLILLLAHAEKSVYWLLTSYSVAPLLVAFLARARLPHSFSAPLRRRRLSTLIGQKSWTLGASAIAANASVSLPFLVIAPWISPEKLGWLHLGAMSCRASASLTEPVGMTLYSRLMGHPGGQTASKFLWYVNGLLGVGISLIGWIAAELMVTFKASDTEFFRMVQPLALLPMIIATSHLVAVSILFRKSGRTRHLHANLCGLLVSAIGTWVTATLTGSGTGIAWMIVAGEFAVFSMLSLAKLQSK
ncbi:MAG: hypothetical protein EOP24_34215 [Hyphomicrobiales bacterium]|nr:MAG: hypothetical protein EOP24_34215 [Hyphomicrobiales bacterium]